MERRAILCSFIRPQGFAQEYLGIKASNPNSDQKANIKQQSKGKEERHINQTRNHHKNPYETLL